VLQVAQIWPPAPKAPGPAYCVIRGRFASLRRPRPPPLAETRATPLAFNRPIAYLSRMRKPAYDPCIPTRGTKVPDRPEWFHEIKHDGYRLIVQREGNTRGYGPVTAMTGAAGTSISRSLLTLTPQKLGSRKMIPRAWP
jgi:hypothetical protein